MLLSWILNWRTRSEKLPAASTVITAGIYAEFATLALILSILDHTSRASDGILTTKLVKSLEYITSTKTVPSNNTVNSLATFIRVSVIAKSSISRCAVTAARGFSWPAIDRASSTGMTSYRIKPLRARFEPTSDLNQASAPRNCPPRGSVRVRTPPQNLTGWKRWVLVEKNNAIWWNINVNLQKLVQTCRYELPTNFQNFTQKDLTKVKIFQNVLRGLLYWNTLYVIDMVFPTNLRVHENAYKYNKPATKWHYCRLKIQSFRNKSSKTQPIRTKFGIRRHIKG